MMGLYGAVRAEADEFRVFANGAAVRNVPFAKVADANAVGIAYVPADRRKEGLLLPHSIDFNLLLPLFASHSAERRKGAQENAITERLAQRLNIRGDRRRPAQALSGGNQQKVALSKWLALEPSVLLLNDPTRGVDVETKREIYLALRAMAAEGKAVVLLSSDTPELVHLCDRVMVFNKGRVAATLPHAEASEEAIVAAAMGVAQSVDAAGGSGLMLGQGTRLYWAIQWRRNEGLGALFLVLAVFAAIYAVLFPGILSVGSMAKFVQGWFPTAMVAAAETIVMLTGGIDLSVGPMVSLGSVVAASTMQGPLGIFGGVLALLALGTGVGAIVGGFVAIGRYPAIIVTLALSFVLRGVALLIMPRPGGFVPPSLSEFLAGTHPTAAVLVVLLVLLWKLYQATPLGIGLIAVGDNAEGAYRSGVSVTTVRMSAYIISANLQAFTGLYVAAQTGSGDPLIGEPLTLSAIAAAVLGGVGFLGGQGAMRGALAGSLLMSILINVMFFMGLPLVAQYVVQGLIIVATVALPLIRASLRRAS